MSRATSIGCPHCDTSAVELDGESPDRTAVPGDGERLKGTTVDCSNCGDEFELYFY